MSDERLSRSAVRSEEDEAQNRQERNRRLRMLGQFYENVLSFADDCVLPLLTRVAVELNPDGSGPARREEMPFASDYFPVELSPIRVEVSCAISPSRPDLPQRELCVYLEPVAESRANIRCVLRHAGLDDREICDPLSVPVVTIREPSLPTRIEAALKKGWKAQLKRKAR